MRSLERMIACVVLLWAVFWTSLGISSQNLGSDLAETDTGLQLEDDIEVFDTTGIAPAPATSIPKNHIPLPNSDFELTTVTSNDTVLANANTTTIIPNWIPGGAGVQIIQSSSYQMSSFAPRSVFAIHLNNPNSPGNSTQGSIATLNLTSNPKPATLYTVQYDCARMPDGPLNLLTALKVSSMSGLVINNYILHRTRYNITDSRKQISWTRQSFVFMGTGAMTSIQFDSMSEKYGPIIDNVVLLPGVHLLDADSAPPPASRVALWQRLCPIFTAIAIAFVVSVQP